jgi:hypothetical protein
VNTTLKFEGALLLGLILTAQCCIAQRLPDDDLVNPGPSADSIAAQIGVTAIDILAHDLGDLSGDGIDEFVAALETSVVIEGTRERLVTIFQIRQGRWILWKSSSAAILNSDEGGFFDPFEDISIHDQKLHISHYGGSNWRWWMNDTYQMDGVDLLLGEHESYGGALCDQKTEWTINLDKGLASCVYSREECPEGFGNNEHLDSLPKSETFEISNALRIMFEQRGDSIISFISPKNGFEGSL